MIQCKRRALSTWTSCNCPACTVRERRTDKARRVGLLPPSPSDAAWALLVRHHAAGWSPAAVASAAGLDERMIDRAYQQIRTGTGRRVPFYRAHAHAILTMKDPTRGQVPAVGAARRLQALSALGYSVAALAAQTGMPVMTVSVIRTGDRPHVRAGNDRAVRETYDRLHMIPGPSRLARKQAADRGWLPPLAWDDIDNPAEAPTAPTTTTPVVDPVAVERAAAGDPVPLTSDERNTLRRSLADRGMSRRQADRFLADHSHRSAA